MATAEILKEIADGFDLYASDQMASIRWQSTVRDKTACHTRAETWKAAANDLRELAAQLTHADAAVACRFMTHEYVASFAA